jgi:hypothetical protein
LDERNDHTFNTLLIWSMRIRIAEQLRRDHVIDLFPALPPQVVQEIAVN